MKKQKGQVVIEFALILPLFLFFLFGIIYCGMLFYDYISLSNIARSAAREAAIVDSLDVIQKNRIEQYYTQKMSSLLTSLYTPTSFTSSSDPSVDYTIKVMEDPVGATDPEGVEVTIIMERNASLTIVQTLLPENYTIHYFMRRDEHPVATSPPTVTE